MNRHLQALTSAVCAILISTMSVGAETEPQHRAWLRKFETPGGSLEGRAAVETAVRRQVDVRRLLRCQGLASREADHANAEGDC